jgi:hypothetical protein
MQLSDLLRYIPDSELEFLAAETKVDHQVKKLSGITIFKLILFSMLHTNSISLRVMEEFVHHASFQTLSGFKEKTRFNSIRDRIVTMNANFFEQIFLRLFDVFNKELSEQKAIVKVDTTSVSISAKLVEWSLRSGGSNPKLRHLKLGIGLKGSLPCHVKIFTAKEATSDDVAIPETVLSSLNINQSIITFDRGVQSRNALTKLSEEKFIYVGRLNITNNYQLVSKSKVKRAASHDSVVIKEDIVCKLMNRKKQWSDENFRIVKAEIKESNESIWFITNNKELSALEIAAIYKQRWEIEVFIKFLKQHLNLNHLVSRTENGLKVMIYMTMILAMLIIVFKRKNKIASYKIAKLRFEVQLDNLLMKEIVILCGGNPERASHLWNSS